MPAYLDVPDLDITVQVIFGSAIEDSEREFPDNFPVDTSVMTFSTFRCHTFC